MNTTQVERTPLPFFGSTDRNPELAPFWDAAQAHKLVLPRCVDCGRFHWYPRANCPFCFGSVEWLPSSGEGVVYSFSVTHGTAAPYAIAYITLAEGVTMLSNIVDCDLDTLAIGQKVSMLFVSTAGGPPLPVFRPA